MKFLIWLILLAINGSVQISGLHAQDQTLVTRWAADVTPDNVLPEYPRPQMVRDEWLNLNGLWEFALTTPPHNQPNTFDREILVPFPIESYLSGVQEQIELKHLWYHRIFTVPDEWTGQRILLHFGAVDWRTTVIVNGVELGTHLGGYDAFSFDITDALNPDGIQDIILDVADPTEGTQPRGKQVFDPEGIWYTSTTGIWQTVWIEPVPDVSIDDLRMETDIDTGTLSVSATVRGDHDEGDYTLTIDALDSSQSVGMGTGDMSETISVSIDNPHLWSPDDPFLYDLEIRLMRDDVVVDHVTSYFGMRKIEVAPDVNGTLRLFLNNEPLFHFGLLDQGFFPDGLYTAPTDEALRYDIEVTRQLGFNMIRKHVKVEPERWYYWADRLGVLVWQDMPSGDEFADDGSGEIERSEQSAAQFELELQRMIDSRYNHPSIVMWVLFNEGWGQYDTERLAEWVQDYDSTRLVNSVSGWNDVGAGDVYDIHSYPGPDAPPPDEQRALVLGEFGGLGLPIEAHTWVDQENWGYRQFTTTEDLFDAYTNLIEQLQILSERDGLAAAVYTQTTDVETEVNGMMTYDREVIKMDVEQVRILNSLVQYDQREMGAP